MARVSTNTTGSTLGFGLTDVTIARTGSGSSYVYWQATIKFEVCTFAWFCEDGESPFKVNFYGYNDGGNPNVIMNGGEVPFQYDLFTTP